MNTTELFNLATAARPLNEADWGTERQINALNAFHEAIRDAWPQLFPEGGEFDSFCLKATDDEQVLEALRRIEDHRQRAAMWEALPG